MVGNVKERGLKDHLIALLIINTNHERFSRREIVLVNLSFIPAIHTLWVSPSVEVNISQQ